MKSAAPHADSPANRSAILVDGLWKEYRIGHATRYQGTLYELLSQALSAPFGKRRSQTERRSESETFWALRDLHFSIRPGEVVGVIGRNGAGKSTLLKILSRISPPTRGRAEVRGRLASLLEVGTGFHPELSGRENIFLNGAILGMTRREVLRKFDEIVAFAEVEQFVDTPVKRYSSGMYVRLAFAVAAHLESEILLVDEVLAVGDASFQKKCLGKLGEISGQGRTVLFVSHSMNAIEELCGRVLLLGKGSVIEDSSDVRRVIDRYLADVTEGEESGAWEKSDGRFENAWFDPLRFALEDGAGNPLRSAVRNDGDTWVVIEGQVKSNDPALSVGYSLHSADGRLLFWSLTTDQEESRWPAMEPGFRQLRTRIPPHLLNEGEYRLDLMLGLHYREWIVESGRNAPAITLTIRGGLSKSPFWMSRRPGMLAPVLEWEVAPTRERGPSASLDRPIPSRGPSE